MRPLLTLLAAALLGMGANACGSAGDGTHSSTRPSSGPAASRGGTEPAAVGTAPAGGYLKNDDDKDADDRRGGPGPGSDDSLLLAEYGSEASPADKRAIAIAVKAYYAAVADGDDAKACSLLTSSLATALAESQSPSTRNGGGGRCATAVSSMFAHQRKYLAAQDAAAVVVTDVHVRGDLGLAALGFRSAPEASMLVEREGRTWKLGALYASVMP